MSLLARIDLREEEALELLEKFSSDDYAKSAPQIALAMLPKKGIGSIAFNVQTEEYSGSKMWIPADSFHGHLAYDHNRQQYYAIIARKNFVSFECALHTWSNIKEE